MYHQSWFGTSFFHLPKIGVVPGDWRLQERYENERRLLLGRRGKFHAFPIVATLKCGHTSRNRYMLGMLGYKWNLAESNT